MEVEKSKGLAYALWFIGGFGWIGLHRFYMGKIGTGILWFLTGGLLGIGCIVDLFILSGQVDAYNTNVKMGNLKDKQLEAMTNITTQSAIMANMTAKQMSEQTSKHPLQLKQSNQHQPTAPRAEITL